MKKNVTMAQIMQNTRYRGKHLIIADGKLYTAKTGEKASEILEQVRKKNPNVVPEVAYMPKTKYIII